MIRETKASMGMWNQGGLARPGALRGKTLENVTFELSPETSMGVGLRMREVQEVGALPRPPLSLKQRVPWLSITATG